MPKAKRKDEGAEYFGEVSIHFKGGGKPLAMSISFGAANRINVATLEQPFLVIRSMTNQIAIVRTAAISDLYCADDASDTAGPEHENGYGYHGPSDRDQKSWETLEHADTIDDEDTVEEAPRSVVDAILAVPTSDSANLQKLARYMTYQLSDGKQRSYWMSDNEALHEALMEVVDGTSEEEFIEFNLADEAQYAYVRKDALDYIVAPAHKYDLGDE